MGLGTIIYFGLAGYYTIGLGVVSYILYRDRRNIISWFGKVPECDLSDVEMIELPVKLELYDNDYHNSQMLIQTLDRTTPIR